MLLLTAYLGANLFTSEPWGPHLENGENNSNFRKWLWSLNKMKHGKICKQLLRNMIKTRQRKVVVRRRRINKVHRSTCSLLSISCLPIDICWIPRPYQKWKIRASNQELQWRRPQGTRYHNQFRFSLILKRKKCICKKNEKVDPDRIEDDFSALRPKSPDDFLMIVQLLTDLVSDTRWQKEFKNLLQSLWIFGLFPLSSSLPYLLVSHCHIRAQDWQRRLRKLVCKVMPRTQG